MKRFLFIAILILAVLISGCTTPAPATGTSTVAGSPALTGNWTGSMQGDIEGTGYTTYSNGTMTLTVTSQNDRLFSGRMVIPLGNGTDRIKEFAGVIGRDGKTLTLVEHGGGYSTGTLISPDELEIIYANDAEPFSIVIDSLKRV
jgi:hypothetical protein